MKIALSLKKHQREHKNALKHIRYKVHIRRWGSMRLYRIISLETFIDLLHNKRERYVRPATWEDTFEGYLYSKLYDAEERKKIVRDIYYNVCPGNYKATIDNVLKLEHAKWFVYGQSWSSVSESDAMWRIYSFNRHSIQIQTTDTRICNILDGIEDIKYEIKSMKYDVAPQDDLMHMQVGQLKDTLSVYEPFLHKRKAFKHEAERRVLIDDTRWYHMLSMNIMGANWKIFETMQGLEDDEILEEIDQRLSQYVGHVNADKIPDNYYVDINNLPKYILGVNVNPFAEKWYVDLIENLCAEYDLKFLGNPNCIKVEVSTDILIMLLNLLF